jgi:lambda repressor-like predicted transcriptional regulator
VRTPMGRESRRRDCLHPRVRHVHGTRAAYVADRCRCASCREANRVAGRARSRAIAFGRWNPFVDAAGVRVHVERLRAAGIGVDRLVELSGVGSGTLRQLIYGDPRTGAPVQRIRQDTAARLLSIPATSDSQALHALVDAWDTHQCLHALIEAGWSISVLAEAMARTPASLRASLRRARVTADTAVRVHALCQRTLATLTSPDVPAPAEKAVSHAQATVWRPARAPLGPASAFVDVADPVAVRPQEDDDVDEVAVERAMHGDRLTLNTAELTTAIRRLSVQGLSLRQIADRLGISPRTVSRRLARHTA